MKLLFDWFRARRQVAVGDAVCLTSTICGMRLNRASIDMCGKSRRDPCDFLKIQPKLSKIVRNEIGIVLAIEVLARIFKGYS